MVTAAMFMVWRRRRHNCSMRAVLPLPTGAADADGEGALLEVAGHGHLAQMKMTGGIVVFVRMAVAAVIVKMEE